MISTLRVKILSFKQICCPALPKTMTCNDSLYSELILINIIVYSVKRSNDRSLWSLVQGCQQFFFFFVFVNSKDLGSLSGWAIQGLCNFYPFLFFHNIFIIFTRSIKTNRSEQISPRSDTAECGIWSGSTLFGSQCPSSSFCLFYTPDLKWRRAYSFTLGHIFVCPCLIQRPGLA